MSETESPVRAYASRVGQRLRDIRRQKGLSLQEVESSSSLEFKASVLGAYERGERIISVSRLQRLAGLYNVPVDQLLPQDADEFGRVRGDDEVIDLTSGETPTPRPTRRPEDERVSIDLTKLQGIAGQEREMLGRYLGMIQVQRQDFNGRMLTIRRDDLRAIACILDSPVDSAGQKLDELGLRLPK